jgi:GTP-binding protein HflX
MVENVLFERFETVIVRLPFQQGQLISLYHDLGQVERIEQERTGVIIYGSLPGRLIAQFKPFLFNPNSLPDSDEDNLD